MQVTRFHCSGLSFKVSYFLTNSFSYRREEGQDLLSKRMKKSVASIKKKKDCGSCLRLLSLYFSLNRWCLILLVFLKFNGTDLVLSLIVNGEPQVRKFYEG